VILRTLMYQGFLEFKVAKIHRDFNVAGGVNLNSSSHTRARFN
jgi:hypothetical protein